MPWKPSPDARARTPHTNHAKQLNYATGTLQMPSLHRTQSVGFLGLDLRGAQPAARAQAWFRGKPGEERERGGEREVLTVKVNLLHNVFGFDALLLVADEDGSRLRLRPAVLAHPGLQLVVCQDKRRRVKGERFVEDRTGWGGGAAEAFTQLSG